MLGFYKISLYAVLLIAEKEDKREAFRMIKIIIFF